MLQNKVGRKLFIKIYFLKSSVTELHRAGVFIVYEWSSMIGLNLSIICVAIVISESFSQIDALDHRHIGELLQS